MAIITHQSVDSDLKIYGGIKPDIEDVKSQLAQNTSNRPSLKSFSDTTYTNKFKSAVLNTNKIFIPNEDITITDTISIAKQMIIEGLGRDGLPVKFTGNGNFFTTSTSNSLTVRDLRIDANGSLNSVGINVPNGGNVYFDSLRLVNFLSKCISIKSGMNHYLANLWLYGSSTNPTAIGIELSPSNGDWNNVATILNSVFSWCNTGIDIGGVVTQTIKGCTFDHSIYGINFRTTPPQPSMDISIENCYFENAGTALNALNNGLIYNVKIRDCYFATQQIANMQNIDGLLFDNCVSSPYDASIMTNDVILSNITNLKIRDSDTLRFKTASGRPILTSGHNKYKENIIKSNRTPSVWSPSANVTVKNTNTENIYFDGRLTPSMAIPSGNQQGTINLRTASGRNGGSLIPMLRSRVLGGKFVAKVVGATKPVSVSLMYQVTNFSTYTKNLKAVNAYVGEEFKEVTGNCITPDDVPASSELDVYLSITKTNPSDNITVYFDKLQGWFDYLEAPNYVETINSYMQMRRNVENVVNTDLTEIPGLYFNKGEIIWTRNNADFKGYVCTTNGFNVSGVNLWTASTSYLDGQYVKTASGHLLLCVQGGTSGATEPLNALSSHNKDLMETDNTCIWLCMSDGAQVAVFDNLNNKSTYQANSAAADVTALKNDFNTLLTNLKNAGIMKTS